MNDKTLAVKLKVEKDLVEATRRMERFDFGGVMGYQPINYNYWKKECIDLRKELREITTGRVIY